MNYLGSKKKLAPWILKNSKEIIEKHTNLSFKEGFDFSDIFAGTGQVTEAFYPYCKSILVNDFQPFSYKYLNRFNISNEVFKKAENYGNLFLDKYELNPKEEKEIENCNFYKWYAGKYFSEENTKRIIKLKNYIELYNKKEITSSEIVEVMEAMEILLIEAADKVQNCTSNYSAYLKKIKPSAQKKLVLSYKSSIKIYPSKHVVTLQEDANELADKLIGDVLYLDPPYNHRQYWTNYHILNTIASWDLSFTPVGKTFLPPKEKRKSSLWSYKNSVETFLRRILESEFKVIILSYNDEGILSKDFIKEEMEKKGLYFFRETDYNKFKSKKGNQRKTVKEQLHFLIKQ